MPNNKKTADTTKPAIPSGGFTLALSPSALSSSALGFMVVCLVVYLLHVSAAITIPFVLSVCLWYLINAMARGLGRLCGPALPRMVCFVIAILFFATALWLTVTLINHNVRLVRAAIPTYQSNLELMLPKLLAFFGLEREIFVGELKQYVNLTAVMTWIAALFTGLAGKSMVVMFYTGFLLYEQQFFERKIQNIFSDKETETRVRHILKNIDISMQRYISVKVVINAFIGLFTYLALKYFGVNFNQFWGLLAFVLNFIPYIGPLFSIGLPSVIALIQFGDVGSFFAVLAALSAIQISLATLVDPRLPGATLNISPIMTIFSLAAWAMIWGVPGMFLAVPIIAMVVITLGQFPQTRPIAVFLTKNGRIDTSDVPKEKIRKAAKRSKA